MELEIKKHEDTKLWRLLSEGYGSEELGLKKFTQVYLVLILQMIWWVG